MNKRIRGILVVAAMLCAAGAMGASPSYPTVGRVTAFDPSFNAVVAGDARIEKIADGITWAEGPAWVRDGGYLLFTDVPKNRLYRWSEKEGLSVFLEPSGYAGPDDGTLREPGANGLFVEPAGTVLLADSGSRALARLDLGMKAKTMLATQFDGKRFNSPNDMVRRGDGTVFFTDPPYGLRGMDRSPARELTISGVYRLDRDGTVHLVDDSLKFPNGVVLSPDGRRLYVSSSDPANPVWMVYTLDASGGVTEKRVFADATDLVRAGDRGSPDGMCMAADGKLFTSGPGGLLVFAPDGRRLGRIETGSAVSNCAFGDDGRTVYLTSSSFIARVRVNATGLGFE